jgi:3-oxosteroid 1-dehydrogenase
MNGNATMDVDVCVVGSGISGLAAALSAKKNGLRPVLIEKDVRLGGGTAVSAGAIWVGNNPVSRRSGVADSREAVLTYMRWVGGAELDEQRLVTFVDRAPEALDFFERCGVEFQAVPALGDHYFSSGVPGSLPSGRIVEAVPISGLELGAWKDRVRQWLSIPGITTQELISSGGIPNAANWDPQLHETLGERNARAVWGRGLGLVAQFLRAALAHDVPIELGTGAKRLLREHGRIVGVETESGGRITAAKGVVLTTGGYESDAKLASRYEGLPGWQSMFPPGLTGDGLTLAGDVGAAVRVIRNNAALFLGYSRAKTEQGEAPFQLASVEEMCCPHTLVVNRAGQRFADESFFQHVVMALREYDASGQTYPNLPCYLIFDRQFTAKFGFSENPAGTPIPDWVQRAHTLADLARKLGVDGAALEQTVERFNGFAELGRDPDFHRGETTWGAGNKRVGPLTEAPFYGVELHPSAFASAGVVADERARVLDHRGAAIAGLYASGNVAVHTEYGIGYQGGHSLASGMTFSHLAVLDMVGA